jgi:Barrel-sandwich domain of CusB or HlyD membrane-fusion
MAARRRCWSSAPICAAVVCSPGTWSKAASPRCRYPTRLRPTGRISIGWASRVSATQARCVTAAPKSAPSPKVSVSFTTTPYIFTQLERARAYTGTPHSKVTYLLVHLAPHTDVERVRKQLQSVLAKTQVLLGDLSGLRVRAEVHERDVGKIKLGGKAVVRADAFRGREFTGKVVSIAPLVQPARINSPGSRNLSDFSVTDVLIELSDPGPMVGMKVDVYFQHEVAAL